jgi:hypothetical protein
MKLSVVEHLRDELLAVIAALGYGAVEDVAAAARTCESPELVIKLHAAADQLDEVEVYLSELRLEDGNESIRRVSPLAAAKNINRQLKCPSCAQAGHESANHLECKNHRSKRGVGSGGGKMTGVAGQKRGPLAQVGQAEPDTEGGDGGSERAKRQRRGRTGATEDVGENDPGGKAQGMKRRQMKESNKGSEDDEVKGSGRAKQTGDVSGNGAEQPTKRAKKVAETVTASKRGKTGGKGGKGKKGRKVKKGKVGKEGEEGEEGKEGKNEGEVMERMIQREMLCLRSEEAARKAAEAARKAAEAEAAAVKKAEAAAAEAEAAAMKKAEAAAAEADASKKAEDAVLEVMELPNVEIVVTRENARSGLGINLVLVGACWEAEAVAGAGKEAGVMAGDMFVSVANKMTMTIVTAKTSFDDIRGILCGGSFPQALSFRRPMNME